MTGPSDQTRDGANGVRARRLLAMGATIGLVMATAGVVEDAPELGWPDEAAVLVNGVTIRQSAYQRALDALAQDSREPLSDDDREHVLSRLIEEELLVQRAQSLGLDRTDPVVRNTLVSAMIETIVSGVGQEEPSIEEVARFYESNREFFAPTDRLWVRQLRFPVPRGSGDEGDRDARERAREAARRLRAGEALPVVGEALGAGGVVAVPDGPLPLAKLREYLGPTPARAAAALEAGEVSDPVRGGSAWHVLLLVDRIASPAQPLPVIESQVRAEMRRRAGDESLRSYLDDLRADADVRLPPS